MKNFKINKIEKFVLRVLIELLATFIFSDLTIFIFKNLINLKKNRNNLLLVVIKFLFSTFILLLKVAL